MSPSLNVSVTATASAAAVDAPAMVSKAFGALHPDMALLHWHLGQQESAQKHH